MYLFLTVGVNTQKKLVESKYGEIKKENEVRSLKTLYDNNNVGVI